MINRLNYLLLHYLYITTLNYWLAVCPSGKCRVIFFFRFLYYKVFVIVVVDVFFQCCFVCKILQETTTQTIRLSNTHPPLTYALTDTLALKYLYIYKSINICNQKLLYKLSYFSLSLSLSLHLSLFAIKCSYTESQTKHGKHALKETKKKCINIVFLFVNSCIRS